MFGFGKKKQNNSNNVNNDSMALEKPRVSLEKLEKSKVSLDKHLVNLKKEKNVDLTNLICRVIVIMDRSGSMYGRFHNGIVQNTLTRVFPLALKFDDDGQMEVIVFDEDSQQISNMTMENFDTYVEKEVHQKGYGPRGNGTNYAPAIRQAIACCDTDSRYPLFALFITDGGCWDVDDSDEAFRESSNHNMFIQCVGIGNEDFSYLRKIDDLDGRKVDNTAFLEIESLSNLSDDELYAKLLEQYPQWLQARCLISVF